MSERPTPRTASAMMELPARWNSVWVVPAEIACDLESELNDAISERDEAREDVMKLLDIKRKHEHEELVAAQENDRLKRECVAIESWWHQRVLREVQRVVEARHKLELCMAANSDVARIAKERDEAREHLREIKEYGTEEINAAVELRQKLASALVERDEAREALKAFQPLEYHDCSLYKDIMGNCIICKNKETK
jgi:hypothetical protein